MISHRGKASVCFVFGGCSQKRKHMKRALLSIGIVLMMVGGLFAQQLEKRDDGYYKDGVLFTGKQTTTYGDGTIESERNFVQGQEDGTSVYYFKDGKVKENRLWSNGKKHGIWVTWNDQGIKTGEAGYQNDQKHGKWFIWDDKGVLRYEMNYAEGKKIGTWFMWDENGNLIEEKNF